jgi:hypothetical protein
VKPLRGRSLAPPINATLLEVCVPVLLFNISFTCGSPTHGASAVGGVKRGQQCMHVLCVCVCVCVCVCGWVCVQERLSVEKQGRKQVSLSAESD